MATPGSSSIGSVFTELVTTTHKKVRAKAADNLTNRNALLKYIDSHGGKRSEDGGLTIVEPLDYASNSTYQRYSDYDVLDTSASEVISAAEFPWRQIAIHVVASGREMRMNSGDSAIFKLAAARLKNAYRTFDNSFSSDLYSDGTTSNQINGLQALVPDAPTTGTVGGINAATWTFWQSSLKDASVSSVTTSSTTIENGLMNPLWLLLDRGPNDQTDLVIMDSVYFAYFEGSQTSMKRYNDSTKGTAGFTSLKYKNADVLYEASGIPASHAYFLNMNYIKLVVHKDADMEVIDDMRPINQDASVTPILWMGNLTISNRKLQGVIIE